MGRAISALFACVLLAQCGGSAPKKSEQPTTETKMEAVPAEVEPDPPQDHMALGRAAVERGDYDGAFAHFHLYSEAHPDDPMGSLFCAQAKLLGGKCEQAMALYYQALKRSGSDERISRGVAHCSLQILRASLKDAPEAPEPSAKAIKATFEGFREALLRKQWPVALAALSLEDTAKSMGVIPLKASDLETSTKELLAMTNLSSVAVYLEKLQIEQVTVKDDVARVALKFPGGEQADAAYLRKVDGGWKIAYFTELLLERGGR